MERRARVRITALLLVMATLFSLFVVRIYKLQSSVTEETIQQQDALTYQTTVYAARGQILDRNGTVLVTNRASYNLVIINFVLFNGPSPNESLLELIHTCDELGIEIEHHLPVSQTRPYEFTREEQNTTWQNNFIRFIRSHNMDSDIAAGTFMNNLRENYNLPEDLSDEDAYRLIAIRYELELRNIEGMPLDNYTLAYDVDAEDLAAIIELGIPGVIVETSTVREYKTKYAAHLLGYTTKMSAEEYADTYKELGYPMNASIGQDGVEKAFEEYLHGQDGLMWTTVTSDGEILDQGYYSVPVPGGNVELTIDLGLQQVAEEALESWILQLRAEGLDEFGKATDAKGGAVVVMDVNNGEVLASASYPTYDPNTFLENYSALAADTEYSPLVNRCLKMTYPPGSTYKMVTAITGMECEGISRWYEVVDEGTFTKFEGIGFAPACHIYRSSGRTHGRENMMDAIRDSCNFYFYDVGLQVSTSDMDYIASLLGLGEPTGSELPEYVGRRANPESKAETWAGTANEAWVEGDKLQAAIGQSLNEFTPMQLAVYVSTLANGGTRYEATFLRRVVSWDFQDLLVESRPVVAAELELGDETKAMLKEGMIAATEMGATADPFSTEFYPIQVAAKTGTAQHGDGTESDNASMVCYAPADNPQVAIAIYVENGATGGKLAYIAMDIFDAYFSQAGKYETVYGENEVR